MDGVPDTPDTFLGYPCVPAWGLKNKGAPLFGPEGISLSHWSLAVLIREKLLVVISKPGAFGRSDNHVFAGVHLYGPSTNMRLLGHGYYQDALEAYTALRKELKRLIGEP